MSEKLDYWQFVKENYPDFETSLAIKDQNNYDAILNQKVYGGNNTLTEEQERIYKEHHSSDSELENHAIEHERSILIKAIETHMAKQVRNKICCPKCNSRKVVSIDNETLSHDEKWFEEKDIQHDYEVYIKFRCECGNTFTETFDIVPRYQEKIAPPVKKTVSLFIQATVDENTDVNQLAINTRLAMENSKNVTSVASEIKVQTQEQVFTS